MLYYTDKSYEEGLLMWVRQTLANYPDLNIKDFSSRHVPLLK
jgi:hypothetical protein